MSTSLWPMRRLLRTLWCFLVFIVISIFPFIVWKFHSTGYSVRYQAWFYGGIFVLLTLPVSIYEMALHLEYYTRPDLQKFVIRISWMVPFYSLDAWLSLRFFTAHVYVDPLRECYEAFVIYSFYSYLVAYLVSKVGNLEIHLLSKPELNHIWGVQYLCKTWPMGGAYLWQCKKGILNYVVLRPFLAALGMISEAGGFHNVGSFFGMWFWIFLINNFSQIWAIYCLVMFYRATREDLDPIRPIAKFLLIKAIVFLTFWQSIAISIVFSLDLIKTEKWTTYDTDDVSAGVQNFFICVEMFIAALAFAYVFPPKDYMDESDPRRGFFKNVFNMFDVRDVVDDVSSHFEDGMIRSKEQVRNVTHQIGKMFKSPGSIMNRNSWTDFSVHEEEAGESLLQSSSNSSFTNREVALSSGPSSIGNEERNSTGSSEVAAAETQTDSEKEIKRMEVIRESDSSPHGY
eukprot:g9247.t1